MELYLKIAQVTQIRKEYTIRFGRQCYPLVSHLGTLLESLTPSIEQIPPKRSLIRWSMLLLKIQQNGKDIICHQFHYYWTRFSIFNYETKSKYLKSTDYIIKAGDKLMKKLKLIRRFMQFLHMASTMCKLSKNIDPNI